MLLNIPSPRFYRLPKIYISSRLPSLQLPPPNGILFRREFSVFDEFSKKIKGEVDRNRDFQQSMKEMKEKAEDLKGVKEDLKARTKQTTEQLYKHVDGVWTQAEEKAKKIAEDMRERWETSDHPVVHKIQDISETVLGESDAAMSFKEIRRRDPTFSLPEFVAEVQEVVKPVLNAYFKGDTEVLEKYCSSHVIERCKAEHKAFESQGIFFDNKILHISEVEVRETKMMGETPIIIVAFQTQQVYCIRDRLGAITEGGQDTIHTVYYAWAMQQLDPEELGEAAPYSIWKLREMQQLGVRALI
ncbi:UNVERIFIED_CONTAM: Mitochondrial import inner membrane translocase subunit TIM44-2 [Sesamum calycinum]|uniref:Mitochondrial import inner membrane translocase subunit TIM44-2 n=1 Tax=Sesamum calycinum TaxID=2727403 RepID=A0AAW2JQF5_9LAMI